MVKKTIVVYECDICGKDSRDEYSVCSKCNKDYCPNCSAVIKGKVELLTTKNQERKILFDVDKIMCKECANKLTTREIFGLGDGKPGAFSVAARD